MGARNSVSASVLETSAASVTQGATQNCTTFVNGDNAVVVDGDGNVVSDINQKLSVSISAPCLEGSQLSSSLSQGLSAAISSALSDKSVALTQWMDDTKDSVRSKVDEAISSAVSISAVQDCAKAVNGTNVVLVDGSGNVVEGVAQAKVASLFQSCLFNDSTSADSVSTAATVLNQNLSNVSENPLAFIGDAVDAAFRDAAHSIAAVFIVFFCMLGLYFAFRGERPRRPPGPPAPGPGGLGPSPGPTPGPPGAASSPPQ